MAGEATVVSGNTSYSHAVLYRIGGTMIDLGTLDGPDSYSSASDINDNGQVVGESYTDGGTSMPSSTVKGNMTDLGCLPGGSYQCGIRHKCHGSGRTPPTQATGLST